MNLLKNLQQMMFLVLLIILVKSLVVISGNLDRVTDWLTQKANKLII
jgi:hypothetical protein